MSEPSVAELHKRMREAQGRGDVAAVLRFRIRISQALARAPAVR